LPAYCTIRTVPSCPRTGSLAALPGSLKAWLMAMLS
jgi:hypothetical protein